MRTRQRKRTWAWLLIVGSLGAACAGPSTVTAGNTAGSSTSVIEMGASVCPVTVPASGFVPPPGYPETPSLPGHVWYGTPDLWTSLPVDGSYQPRKSVWWSVNFGGGRLEERPAISVRWNRLGQPAERDEHPAPGTNSYTVADGWFMMAGVDPDVGGCWQVTATYRGATLSYVYDSRP